METIWLLVAIAPVRCPTSPWTPEGEHHTIIGCGSSDIVGPDDEGLYDCRSCGMWWNPLSE